MYTSYFVLFAVLFYNLYIKATGKHAKKAEGGVAPESTGSKQVPAASIDEKICGVDLKRGDAGGFFHTDRAKEETPAFAPASAANGTNGKAARAPASPDKRGKRSKSPASAKKSHVE